MARTKDETIREVTMDYLASISGQNPLPTAANIQGDILDNLKVEFDLANSIKAKGEKWRIPDRLCPTQIAMIIAALHPVAAIETGRNCDKEYTLIGLYQDSGPLAGIYVTTDEVLRNLARSYCFTLTKREYEEMMIALRDIVKVVQPCTDVNLIAVNNGIFDYDTKKLLPFTSEKVFLAKSRVNYNPNAKNITIYNPDDGTYWDVESWMRDLHDDPEVVRTLWEVLGAIVRPNVPWDCSAWFYSETGNNGKGTICELMRQLVGEGSYAAISLSDMSKDFMLEPLTRATAIIVDENDVGTYIDKAANLKAIITGDVVQINRKFKSSIPYKFHGFMVQCLNEMPKIRDKSDSFYRRQLFIPFVKCFTGAERKYIKHDYLHRPEVLEYVLYKVLHEMNYYKISIPDTCKHALEEYKEYNDPIRQFMDEIMPQLQWDLVPFKFLYDLYVRYYEYNFNGTKGMESKGKVLKQIVQLLSEFPEWECPNKDAIYRPGTKMDKPEPLIEEYNVVAWMNPMYVSSKDTDKKCCPPLKSGYKGILRVNPANKKVCSGSEDSDTEEKS